MSMRSGVHVRAECMWTISENKKVFTCVCKEKFLKYTPMSFRFVLIIM